MQSFAELNLSDVDEQTGRKSLDVGDHIVTITEAKVEQAKSGQGLVLKTTYKSKDGKEAKDNITFTHTNSDTQRIGRERLKNLLVACGHPDPNHPKDVSIIVGKKVGIRIEQGEDWYDAATGKTVKGGGKPAKYGAYYSVDEHVEQVSAPPNSASLDPSAPIKEDEIPF